MTQEHPITPPPELVREWFSKALKQKPSAAELTRIIAAHAAQWGYEQHERELLDAMHAVVPQPHEAEDR